MKIFLTQNYFAATLKETNSSAKVDSNTVRQFFHVSKFSSELCAISGIATFKRTQKVGSIIG